MWEEEEEWKMCYSYLFCQHDYLCFLPRAQLKLNALETHLSSRGFLSGQGLQLLLPISLVGLHQLCSTRRGDRHMVV